jgi:CubicO group peptidase (beta-lactamase class C family)
MASIDPDDLVQRDLAQRIAAQEFPGIQYVVVDAQTTRFEFYGGRRDLGADLPVTADTTFMAASSTKVVTAAAVLQLVQRGQVLLDESLSAYYPHHPYGEAVTVRRLLNQSAGIPNPLPIRWLHTVEAHPTFDEEAALQDVLRKHATLAFAPGDKYAYSNISYWLLGKVIEQASGMSYGDYVRAHIAAPLGIPTAELDCTIPDLTRQARGHQQKFSPVGLFLYAVMDRSLLDGSVAGRFRLKPVYMHGPAYGGLNGAARAFARFLQDQLQETPRLLDPATRALYFTPQRDNRGGELVTTLGWHRGRVEDVPYFGKPGGGPGFRSNLRVYPTRGLATVWMINETGVDEKSINAFGDSLDRMFLT